MPTSLRAPPPIAPREPAINLPRLVTVAIAALLGIHGLRALISATTDFDLLIRFSFMPGRWSGAFGFADLDSLVEQAGRGLDPEVAGIREAFARYVAGLPGPYPWTFLTYAALHGSWTHVVLNSVWLAAFGAPVVRRLGGLRSLLLAIAAAIGGSLAHWAANPDSLQPMIGASAVVSGLMAAASLFAFGRRSWRAARGGVLGAYRDLLGNRAALLFLASWLAINVLFGVLAGPLGILEGAIAWEAHMGGLATGLLLFPLIDRRPTRPEDEWIA